MTLHVEIRRGNHGRGEELCRVYVRHWHIGRLIVWFA